MWNYDELFTEGNVIGIKLFNSVINEVVSQKSQWGINNKEDWEIFWNNELKSGEAKIQYIIRLDDNGNVIEKLFDRTRDMKPELKTGMFVKVAWYDIDTDKDIKGFKDYYDRQGFGIVILEQNKIYYQHGGSDALDRILSSDLRHGANIVEVYKIGLYGFDVCNENNCIWRHPEYQKYLDKK